MKRVKILGASILHHGQLECIDCRWAVLHEGDIVALCRTEEEARWCDAGSHTLPLEQCSNEQLSFYCAHRNLFFTRG